MHVLVIPSWYPMREDPVVGNFFFEQAKMLQASGVRVGVIYPEVRPLKTIKLTLLRHNHFQSSFSREGGLPTARMHGWNISPSYLRGTMHVWKQAALKLFKRYVDVEGMPDLLHAHSAMWGGVAAKAIHERYHIPYFVTEHRDNFLHERLLPHLSPSSWLNDIMTDVFSHADKVVAVSRALKKGLKRFVKGPESEISVIPNFLDMDYFQPSLYPKLSSPFTFLTLAHLMKSKNISLLLRAFHQLLERDKQLQLHIGGDGPERASLEQLARELHMESHVRFLGPLQRDAVKKAFSESHVFILPSHYETFGIVLIEALAMGLPVISTRCGGPEDIITEDVGCLIAPDNVHELAASMRSMKDNFEKYPGDRLRAYAMEHFGKEAIIGRYLECYEAQKFSPQRHRERTKRT